MIISSIAIQINLVKLGTINLMIGAVISFIASLETL